MSLRVVFEIGLFFLQTMCGAAELTSRLFGLPTRQPNSGLTCRLGASPLALASVSKIRH